MGALSTIRAVATLLRIGAAETLAFRAEFLVMVVSSTLPLTMLALWTSVAHEAPFGGYRSEDFVAYYLATLIVRTLTSSGVASQVSEEIRLGTLSLRLLRPMHPFVVIAAGHFGAIPLRAFAVVPVAGIMLLSSGASALTHNGWQLAAVLPSLLLAWLLTYSALFAIGTVAFWIRRSMALGALYFALFNLLSGYLLPLDLLPSWIGQVAAYAPFRAMLATPVALMTKHLSLAEIGGALAGQLVWTMIIVALAMYTWRTGLRHFESVGG